MELESWVSFENRDENICYDVMKKMVEAVKVSDDDQFNISKCFIFNLGN